MSPAARGEVAVHRDGAVRMGFFTDTTVCIGCKACEVACKQWNDLPADGSAFRKGGSYDNTGSLGAATWRHVRFVENTEPSEAARADAAGAPGRGRRRPRARASPPCPSWRGRAAARAPDDLPDLVDWAEDNGAGRRGGRRGQAVADMERWVFMSDVCKHCTNAGCLDACPTGALIRTEFETVVLQADVCNGCGYCIPSCPFGVVNRDHFDGRAAKCTLCYDRLEDGLEPACAKSCPTDSIQFGPYDELVETAKGRVVTALHERGVDGRLPVRRRRRADGEQLAGGLGRLLPADPAARALRAARLGRVAGAGERALGATLAGLAAAAAAGGALTMAQPAGLAPPAPPAALVAIG